MPAIVTFTVDTSADDGDDNLGDTVAKTANNEVSLRSVVEHVNANGNGNDTYVIDFLLPPPIGGGIPGGPPAAALDLIIPLESGLSLSTNRRFEVVGTTDQNVIITRGVNVAANVFFSLFSVPAGGGLTLRGLQLTGADRSNAAGGAIDNSGDLTITNCNLAGNLALEGGAINSTGTLNISDSSFINNRGLTHGAIQLGGTGITHINDSLFVNNVAGNIAGVGGGNGGAVAVRFGAVAFIDGCEFRHNLAKNGGAIYSSVPTAQVPTLTVSETTFNENRAEGGGDGGAVYNSSTNALFTECDFQFNVATDEGGAIYQKTGKLTLDDCGSLATNSAQGPFASHMIARDGVALITLVGNTVATVVNV